MRRPLQNVKVAVGVAGILVVWAGCVPRRDEQGEAARACATGIGLVESTHCAPPVQLAGAPADMTKELDRLQAASHAEYVRVQLSELRGRCPDATSVTRVDHLAQTCLARLDRSARATP